MKVPDSVLVGGEKKEHGPLCPCLNFVKEKQADVQKGIPGKIKVPPLKEENYRCTTPVCLCLSMCRLLHLIFKIILGYRSNICTVFLLFT